VITLELADLVVIASRTLGLETGQVLELLDTAAAGQALAQAQPGSGSGDPASPAAALLHALVRRRPLRRGNQQVALAVMLQFLAPAKAATRSGKQDPWDKWHSHQDRPATPSEADQGHGADTPQIT